MNPAAPDADAPQPLPPETAAALDRLDELVQTFEDHPDQNLQEAVFELLRAVDLVHRGPLHALAAVLQDAGLTERALEDGQIALLFDLYDLKGADPRARADAVLDGVRPYIESHGGKLEVLDARDGVVTARLSGACAGCQGSTATLRHVVEEALRAELHEFVRLDVVDPPQPAPDLIPLGSVVDLTGPRLAWRPVLAEDELHERGVRSIEIDGTHVLLARTAADVFAYRNACPGTPMPLDDGAIEDDVLVCPWHGCRFSLHGGRRLDADGPGLEVMPVAVADGAVRVGVLDGA